MKHTLPAVLSIAGSDPSGGAGIQADLKTMEAHGIYGMCAITALTAQNTLGVQGVHEIDPEFVTAQLDSVFADIEPDAVKIGMVSSGEIVDAIDDALVRHEARNVVVDPVMMAESGGNLMRTEAIRSVVDRLFPLATVITPNAQEAAALTGLVITTEEDMIAAARALRKYTDGAVLVKGGHMPGDAVDVLLVGDDVVRLTAPRLANTNTHGTGCTLSSAIASNLATGMDVKTAIRAAKDYVWSAIEADLDMGHGHGPLDHGHRTRA